MQSPLLLSALASLSLTLRLLAAPGDPDLLVADFEGPDYGDWKATGTAFGTGPAQGTLPNQMKVDGFLGRGLVSSFLGGDGTTGTLTSPPLRLERHYLRFLVGGGGFADQTCINLLVEGRRVRTATGPNTQPGGSERLDWQQWEVREFLGQTVTLEIVDRATGGWGHINVDHILQSDRRLPEMRADVTRSFPVERRYLNLPVKNGAPRRLVSLLVDDRVARQFEIELADETPDWWAFLDLTPFRGQTATLRVDQLREDSTALDRIAQADRIEGAENLYRERLRPQFHFTARRGWNNDPNGLVFFEGEYHLFFQHNPYGWSWGNMHWGHAVSRDLVHWEELPIALYPDQLGTMFSGSAVVDVENTAGFKRGDATPLVCFYTAAGGTSAASQGQPFTQCLAYSLDRGRTWTKYEHNPILPHVAASNRDPKVLWHAPSRKWIMALFLDRSDFALFGSPDLKRWERLSDVQVPGSSECPEFFALPLDGDHTQSRWVFYGGNGHYLLGQFDGRQFAVESGPHPLHHGNAFYASQTFSDLPATDGRRILVPWGTVATPGMPFNQMMGLPVTLTLRRTDEGPRLFAWPVRELDSLRASTDTYPAQPLRPGHNPLASLQGDLFDLSAEIEPGQATAVGFTLRGTRVHYDVRKRELTCRDRTAPLAPVHGRLRLRLLLDRTSIDIFGNDGRLYMPMGAIPPDADRSLTVYAEEGEARLESLVVHRLNSAWR